MARAMNPADVAVLILAGGEATRLPDKLTLPVGEAPMLVRVFRNVAVGRTAYISCKGSFAPEIEAQLTCPMVVDRWPLRGPLSGLVSTMSEIAEPYVFACAGDAPLIDAAFVDRVVAAWRPGDEAVVPEHGLGDRRRIEPLAALYDRVAFLREGLPQLLAGRGALRFTIERLRTRYVRVDDPRAFTNVNTPADYAAVKEAR